MGKRKKKKSKQKADPIARARVPRSLVEQAIDFTAPRGRLEMGGLLIGHVDAEGSANVVTGFFPKQIRASPGYCEFDGSWVALAAAACDYANQNCTSLPGPELRVIGWIHTHPDLGLFLSSIDVATYSSLREMSPDSRFLAIVVDPLRDEDGVFPSENRPNQYVKADAQIELTPELREKYHHFIDKIQEIRATKGPESIPAVLPGDLRIERLLMGDSDDSRVALRSGLQKIKSKLWEIEDRLESLESDLSRTNSIQKQIPSIRNRLEFLEKTIQIMSKQAANKASVFSRIFM